MTQEEFKAWFMGFCEGVDSLPTEKQWKRIQARVKEIDGSRITERIFIDRYEPYRYYPPFYTTPYGAADSNKFFCGTTAGSDAPGVAPIKPSAPWNSTVAMFTLGAAEARDE